MARIGKTRKRLLDVLEMDREALAKLQEIAKDAPIETSSSEDLVAKNLALIRAYEAWHI
jgi:hypothetical protein